MTGFYVALHARPPIKCLEGNVFAIYKCMGVDCLKLPENLRVSCTFLDLGAVKLLKEFSFCQKIALKSLK